MIRSQLAVDEMLPADAYVQGWQDHADSLDAGADQEAHLAASRSARVLDSLIERIWQVAPWNDVPEAPTAEVDPAETVWPTPGAFWLVSTPATPRPFDQEQP